MLSNLGTKRNLHFIYLALPLYKKHSRATGQMGARALGLKPWGTSIHYTQPFENVFLPINLDQNMPKNVCFLEKSSVIAKASGAALPNPHLPPTARVFRLQTPALFLPPTDIALSGAYD